LGQLVTIPATTMVTGLGMIGNPGGGNAIMALYADAGGMPTLLLAQSEQATIGNGVNVLPMSPLSLSAGSYWLMAEFSATSTLCNDGGTSNTLIFGSATFGSALPLNFQSVPGGPTTLTNNVVYNFFVVAH
jgi:hypothetical protein